MVWVKICGITNVEDAKYISDLGVDALGFVFFAPSPRSVEVNKAQEIISSLKFREGISIAGVFVNEKIERVVDIAEKLSLDYIQLSGDEDICYLSEIRMLISKEITPKGGKKIIKSIRVGEEEDFWQFPHLLWKRLDELSGVVDYFLLDSFEQNMYGGTGKSFRWEIAENLGKKYPIILSGGLDFQNVLRAIRMVRPYGVDASSKLEISPGKKDWEKVKKFVEAARKRREGKV
ncbi:MAG: phosphoribosylanthranilate isomerase [Actinobacteria bacterium]|nr:phosphoribosylanthranilate isomerase [Actinomycetota bacterium]